MLLFYVAAGALAILTALALARPLVRGAGGAGGAASRESRDAELYRDQLTEVERDLARGTISAAEAEGARAEVSRRLLAAAGRAETSGGLGAAPHRFSRLAAGFAVLGAPVLALAVYLGVGAPGQPDRPLAGRSVEEIRVSGQARPSQAEAESLTPSGTPESPPAELEEYAALITRLEKVMEERPGDAQGLELLANGYMRLGRYAEAWRAYRDLIEAAPDQATAGRYAAMADAMVLATGGYVSPEAEKALGEALAREPGLPMARYYHALAMAQAGRVDEAIAVWEKLKRETPPDAPWMDLLDRTLAEARALRQGGPASGPSAADIAAAEAMSVEERQAMIEGMVGRLEARLTSEGGTPEEWLRLMRAYVQLDRPGEAARVAALGIAAFGDGSEAEFLREQALLMGIEPE